MSDIKDRCSGQKTLSMTASSEQKILSAHVLHWGRALRGWLGLWFHNSSEPVVKSLTWAYLHADNLLRETLDTVKSVKVTSIQLFGVTFECRPVPESPAPTLLHLQEQEFLWLPQEMTTVCVLPDKHLYILLHCWRSWFQNGSHQAKNESVRWPCPGDSGLFSHHCPRFSCLLWFGAIYHFRG